MSETIDYQGRKMNVDDIKSQVDSLIERSQINYKDADKYGEEARKLDAERRKQNK